ncbi:TonB-dependent receptor [Lampropedia aestuarii]|uniref:TonB-dependent receptor n=1 Tax=Lampropedia aestuarii TaxID=2562762 RepID=UPI002469C496|nr:TonB-dependent receptor [Lampropedia aestuarii]MDH5857095.1 TonB-dependent receptor [Lampropedia aestuarii]
MQTSRILISSLGFISLSLPMLGLAQTSAPSPNGEDDASELATVQVTSAPLDSQIAVTGPVLLDQQSQTGSLLGMSVRDTPASITVIDRYLMQAIGAEDTQSALRAVPGVTTQDSPGSPGVNFRGFSANSLAQLFNGINVQYSIAARPVDSWIYDRIEALGGPSSFLYGSGAVGGTVNYITKLAQPGDFSEARLRLGSESLREMSLGLNRRISAEDSDGRPVSYVRLDVNDRRNKGWTDGTRRQATELATSVRTDISPNLTHTLAYEYQREKVDRPYWGTPLLNPVEGTVRIDEGMRRMNFNSADGFYGQRVQWLRSLTEYQVNSSLSLKNTFYAYDALRDFRNVESYRFDETNSMVTRSSALLQRHDQRLVGNRLDAVYKGALAGRESDWAFGLDYSANKQTRFPLSLAGTINVVDPYDFVPDYFWDIEGMAPGFSPDRTVRVKTLALYAENRTKLSPQLQLLTGLRYDRIGLSLTNLREVTAANPAFFKRNYNAVTGRVGLMWEAAPGWNAYVQYATAADPPSGSLSTASFADAINNSDLTTGRQLEVGLKNEFWDGKATSTLAVFQIKRKNISTQDLDNSSITYLVGQQSSKGIEWTAGWQPNSDFSMLGNLAYVKPQYDNYVQNGFSLAGKQPVGMPQWVGNLWGQYQLTPSVSLGAGLRAVASSYVNQVNTLKRPGYTLLDLSAHWTIRPDTQLSARVRNATDKVYFLNSSTSAAYLGAPRAFDVALTVRF